MALEAATFLDGLVTTNPVAGDQVAEGDDHIRLLKTVLKATFPGLTTSVDIKPTGTPQFAGINIGHATDTTVARASAGDLSIEGNIVYRAGGTDVPVTDGGTGASTVAAAASNLGLGTASSPQFAGINIGHPTDTTLARTTAGNLSIEGNIIYRAGGTDVPIADGGTGASTVAAALNNFGLGIGNSPQFAGINLGHASDTTLSRDAAGLISVQGNRIYHRGNILGSVAETGGLPAGAIIERGSNANGTYTKFADGTLICRVGRGGAANPQTWTFPAAFLLTTDLVVSGSVRASAPRFLSVNPISTTAADIHTWSDTGGGSTNAEDLMAVGRWF